MTPVGTIGIGKSSNCGSAERQVRQNVKKKKEIEKKTSDLFSKSHQNLKVSIGKKNLAVHVSRLSPDVHQCPVF